MYGYHCFFSINANIKNLSFFEQNLIIQLDTFCFVQNPELHFDLSELFRIMESTVNIELLTS